MIPAYQAAATIAGAVRSALAQTHPAHEVIVVDDGSTDDLDAALRPFADRSSLIRKENGGGASARNAGAEAASGDFIAILDADDAYHPRRLEALAALARRAPTSTWSRPMPGFVVDGEAVGSFRAHNPFAGRRPAHGDPRELLRRRLARGPPGAAAARSAASTRACGSATTGTAGCG